MIMNGVKIGHTTLLECQVPLDIGSNKEHHGSGAVIQNMYDVGYLPRLATDAIATRLSEEPQIHTGVQFAQCFPKNL